MSENSDKVPMSIVADLIKQTTQNALTISNIEASDEEKVGDLIGEKEFDFETPFTCTFCNFAP